MLRIIGSLMVGGSCFYLGLRKSLVLKQRYASLQKIQNSLSLLETEIAFGGTELKNALLKADNPLFIHAAQDIDKLGIKASWANAVKSCASRLCLTPGDCDTLLMLGHRLGMTDTENQVKNINGVKNKLDLHIRAAKYDTEHFCRLYSGGGALTGAFLVLMLL